jgi:hypothetical protein
MSTWHGRVAKSSRGGRLLIRRNAGPVTEKCHCPVNGRCIVPGDLSTIRYFLVPLFRPGESQSIYFMEQESPGIWRYFNIAMFSVSKTSRSGVTFPTRMR